MNPSQFYITQENQMPQALEFQPIDAVVQKQTITFDFGAGSFLPLGVTLSNPIVTIHQASGAVEDLDPTSRIVAGPAIGTAPSPYGSGLANTAVLIQLANCPGPLTYCIQVIADRSDGDVASMDAMLPVRLPC